MPPEIALQIVKDLTLVEQVIFGQTSTTSSHIVAFHLMQTVTGAVVSGSAVMALAHSGPFFNPGDLTILVGGRQGHHVVDFIRLASDYGIHKSPGDYRYVSGVGHMWTLHQCSTGQLIHVMESLTAAPWDAVAHFHSTALIGSWSASEIRHGYAALTVAGVAITTESHLPLGDTLTEQRKMWHILHKYMRCGFNYSVNELEQPHTCGQHLSCLATLRLTDDGGCLVAKFPQWLFTPDDVPARHTCFSMEGHGCLQGILASTGHTMMPYRTHEDLDTVVLELEPLLHSLPQIYTREEWNRIYKVPREERGFKIGFAIGMVTHVLAFLSNDNLYRLYWRSPQEFQQLQQYRVPDPVLDYHAWCK
ncbi:hypothetical protein C8R43DRAFT_1127294 [Mycena crocata]|nr:hypothetical protein C8R43DRAFT_1127294 [Mycena crocata]